MKNKLIAFLLVLILLLSMIACGIPADDNDDGTKGPADSGTGTETMDPNAGKTNLEIALENCAGLDFEKKTLKILSPSPGKHFYNWSSAAENEIFYDGPSSEALPNAVYNRNLKLADAIGVEIEPIFVGDTGDINTIVTLNDSAGDKEYYDVILTRLDYAINFATNGMLLNFYDIDTMNLENGWWDKEIINTFTIDGDTLYTLSGDLNYFDDYAVQVMFFNKDICEKIGYDNPYQKVRNGEWTIDLMYEMAKKAAYDENGNDTLDPGVDVCGIADNYDAVPHYIFCYDLKMSENDEHGVPKVVMPNDINTAVLDKIYTMFSDTNVVSTSVTASHFMQDKCLFYGEMLGAIPSFRDMETDFGILPMPKGYASMEKYRAYVSNGWTTVFAIPRYFDYTEASEIGAVLECMSAASKDLVTPALYDQLLESKYIRDEESKEMLTYILDSKVYDWAGDLSWASNLRTAYQNVLTNGPSSFTTALKAYEKQLNKALEKLYTNLTVVE